MSFKSSGWNRLSSPARANQGGCGKRLHLALHELPDVLQMPLSILRTVIVLLILGSGIRVALGSSGDPPAPEAQSGAGAPKQDAPKARSNFHAGSMTCGAISPDGKTAVTGGHFQNPIVWDVANKEKLRSLKCDAFSPPWLHALAFSPDGKTVLAADNEESMLWNIADGSVLWHATLDSRKPQLGEEAVAVGFSSDGKLAMAAGKWGRVIVWDAATGKPIHKLRTANESVESLLSASLSVPTVIASRSGITEHWLRFGILLRGIEYSRLSLGKRTRCSPSSLTRQRSRIALTAKQSSFRKARTAMELTYGMQSAERRFNTSRLETKPTG